MITGESTNTVISLKHSKIMKLLVGLKYMSFINT